MIGCLVMKAVRDSWFATHRPQILIIVAVALLALFIAGAVTAPAVAVPTAFLTLIVGIAAQQSLGNIFAGIVLALAHPFRVGDQIKLEAISLDGTVKALGIVYTEVVIDGAVHYVPNATVLSGAVTVHPETPAQ